MDLYLQVHRRRSAEGGGGGELLLVTTLIKNKNVSKSLGLFI